MFSVSSKRFYQIPTVFEHYDAFLSLYTRSHTPAYIFERYYTFSTIFGYSDSFSNVIARFRVTAHIFTKCKVGIRRGRNGATEYARRWENAGKRKARGSGNAEGAGKRKCGRRGKAEIRKERICGKRNVIG